MNIDDLTLGQIKEIQAMCGSKETTSHPYPTGQNVFIRTVTMHYTGKLVRVTNSELVLEDAAWIADSGRFSVALSAGTLNEVEPYPPGEVVISRGAVVDVSRWNHALPRTVK